MAKPSPRYELIFKWGDFYLNIVGRRTLLIWAGAICSLIGAKLFWPALLEALNK
jgi:hypothetical protein